MRGQQQGVFQAGLDARDVHRLISSFGLYARHLHGEYAARQVVKKLG
ncbi:hypothetical protein [Enterobacter hormaechei]